MTSPNGTLGAVASLFATTLYQGSPDKGARSSGILEQLQGIHSICKCWWNVATYIEMGKLK
jgi:hypothetical protein